MEKVEKFLKWNSDIALFLSAVVKPTKKKKEVTKVRLFGSA